MKFANYIFIAIFISLIFFSQNLNAQESQFNKYAGYPFCSDVIEAYRLKAWEKLESHLSRYTENANKYVNLKLDSISTTDQELERLLNHVGITLEPRVEILSDGPKEVNSYSGSGFPGNTEVLRLEMKIVKKDEDGHITNQKPSLIPFAFGMIKTGFKPNSLIARPVKMESLFEGDIILASTKGVINDAPAYVTDCWAGLPDKPEATYYNEWKHYSLLKIVFETYTEDNAKKKRYSLTSTSEQMINMRGKDKTWNFEKAAVLFPADHLIKVEFRNDIALAYTGNDTNNTPNNPLVIRALKYVTPWPNAMVYKLSKLNFNYYVLAPMQTENKKKDVEKIRVLVENDLNG